MTDKCEYCGTDLIGTTWGRKHCPNCGIIKEEEKDSDEVPSYV